MLKGFVMRHLFLSVCVLILSTALPVVAAPSAVAPKATAAPTKPKLAAAPDGPRIVEQRGKFAIRRNTLFCYDRKVDGRIKKVLGDKYIGEGFEGALINDKLDAAAKDKTVPREDRVGPWHDKYLCGHGGDIISILLTTGMNPLGKPYQLELEARQGAGAYVKVVFVKLGLPDDVQLFRVDPIGDDGRTAASTLNWQYRVSIGRSARSASKILVDELFK
jgi:hypothetical protein